MSKRAEQAATCFREGCNCSQAVLSVYAEQLGLGSETAMRLASGFGGGIGRMGEICGALSGSLMVIGLRYGPSDRKDKQTKEKTYELVREFAGRFKARNGSILCRELLGFDISTPEGKELAKKPGSFERCPGLVQEAVEILDEMFVEKPV